MSELGADTGTQVTNSSVALLLPVFQTLVGCLPLAQRCWLLDCFTRLYHRLSWLARSKQHCLQVIAQLLRVFLMMENITLGNALHLYIVYVLLSLQPSQHPCWLTYDFAHSWVRSLPEYLSQLRVRSDRVAEQTRRTIWKLMLSW